LGRGLGVKTLPKGVVSPGEGVVEGIIIYSSRSFHGGSEEAGGGDVSVWVISDFVVAQALGRGRKSGCSKRRRGGSGDPLFAADADIGFHDGGVDSPVFAKWREAGVVIPAGTGGPGAESGFG